MVRRIDECITQLAKALIKADAVTGLAVDPDIPPVSPLRRSARSTWLSRNTERF
jgi:hypothetical protein